MSDSLLDKFIRAKDLKFLAKLEIIKEITNDIKSILVVNEFIGVFPKELTLLSLKREIAFIIVCSVTRNAPIVRTLYKMATKEL